MPLSLTKRRLMLGLPALALVLLAVVLGARLYFAGLAVGTVLRQAGATEVSFRITQASLWQAEVKDLGFLLRLQPFAAERVTLQRAHWWTPSLGALRVEGARMPVKLAELAPRPAPAGGAPRTAPARLPLEEISIDGQLVVQADGQPDRALTVKVEARPDPQGDWEGRAQVSAPGLHLAGEGCFDPKSGAVDFKLPAVTLELKPWQSFLEQLVPLPAGDWVAEGKIIGRAEGRYAGDKLAAHGRVQVREGRVVSTAKAITAEGIEADLEFSDFASLVARPGTLRVRELRTGQLTLNDLAADFSLEGPDRIAVQRASLRTLGGSVTAEPFLFVPSRGELEAVLLADGISVEEVMALTRDLPARATGRVNGRVPVRIGRDGLKLGTGWLELKPGIQAEIEFNAKGLLTGGASAGTPTYAVLQRLESGLLKLRLNELRLDIRPPNAPEGRSGQLHLKGEPVDPGVKAPVILDLNVNGPLEKLINMGMDSRLSLGTKP